MNTWTIGVLGAGKMGVGIAQLYAAKGFSVRVCYAGNDLERGDSADVMRANLQFLADNAVIKPEEIEPILARVTYTEHLKDLADNCEIIFESVVELLEVKQDYFRQLDELAPLGTILATNTSAISITRIAEKAVHKERIIGTHFWNPAYLIPLVEVIKTASVAEEIVEKTCAVLEAANKKAVVVQKDVPGFLANRLQHALFREAISIVEHGIALPKDVDESIKYGFGMRLGIMAPFEVMDSSGLDLTYNIHSYLFEHLEDTHQAQPSLNEHIAQGELGFKSNGKGYQNWTPEEMRRSARNLNEGLIKVARALGRL